MKRSIRRPEWRGFLVGGLLIFAAPGLAQNNFPLSGNVGIGIGASATGTTANILHIDAAAGGQLHLTSGANSGTTTSDGTLITHYSDNNLYITNMENADVLLNTNGGVERMRVTSAGNVGIGTGAPAARLHVAGDVQVDGNLAAKYQDVAEWVPTPTPLPPGVVVVVDPHGRNRVLAASGAYDTRVAGVVSSRPGLLLGEGGNDKVKVAHSGRVRVKVDASYGPVAVGDLLVTSPTAGHAMRSTPVELGGTSI